MLKEERKGYIGNPRQLYTLRRLTAAEGKARGTQIIEVCTAGGLQLDLLPDAGLDIGQTRYRGINMSWMSKNGYDSLAERWTSITLGNEILKVSDLIAKVR